MKRPWQCARVAAVGLVLCGVCFGARVRDEVGLPTLLDRFYPDFVALLKDGRVLAVEYKGEDRCCNDDSKEKRLVGEVWAERSGGRCLFVMPKGKRFEEISAKVGKK